MSDEYLERLHLEFPNIDFVVCSSQDELPQVMPGAQALIGGPLTPELLARSPDLRWLQSNSAGVDRLLTPELIEHDIIITNYSGAQASNMAEHIVAMMFAFARGLPMLIRRQPSGEWTTQPSDELPRLPQTRFFSRYTFELKHQTLAIAGLGDVGCELAVRAKGLGMRVVGSKRRPDIVPESVDQVYGPDDWYEMLADADHVAVCLPLTARTRHLFGQAEFATMKTTAHLYNVSRGGIIDQNALIQALNDSEIAGAGLDVTTPEPLPPESPLWYIPNVLITCHTSGASPQVEDRGLEIIVENIHRYLRDEPLMNVVDKREGY
jgi:phosphoglycerate dehydrogenase-like enzyme